MSEYERYVLDSNQRIMDSLEGSLANSLASMISGTKSALDVWKSLWANIAQAIIAEISKIIVKALFANALLKSLGIATGNIGAFFGIGTGAMTPVAQDANLFNNNPIPYTLTTPNNNNNIMQLMRKIDSLIDSIENNPPQIYTQLIEGVPLNNAVRRAAVMANEL